MALSPADSVTVEALGAPTTDFQDLSFENFTAVSVKNSITEQAEASFELGNDGSFLELQELITLGGEFRVRVNNRSRMKGRIESIDSPADATQSTTQRFVVRTKISDAMYASANQNIRVKGVSIIDFVRACYESIGISGDDIKFDVEGSRVARDLLTGKPTRGGRAARDLEPLKEDQAKVQPPETVWSAVDRHLRRHGLLHWDGPDGDIIVSAPDDTQEPIYDLRSVRGFNQHLNNIQTTNRQQSVETAPTSLGVFGKGGKRSFTKAKIHGIFRNQDLIDRQFSRQVIMVDEGMKTKELAERRANREAALRNRGLDRIPIRVDGLSFFDGSERILWSPDTTVDVITDQAGGALGKYYIETVDLERSTKGDFANLQLVREGIWVL